ncbi:metalloregulator ArsR/SmtB family transcription factor [Macrococcoides canis]|uniref:metalloregulator ArsR/SmtB family transcription factor n=1 Tax=Macrococcoides canis TaxID=1855823 RepID=UPI0013051110|nr:metalloregulator ArsR/SmtB family transcription factor [Macrococcus canis]
MIVTDIYKVLGDESRRTILNILKDGSKTVSEINQYFDVSLSNTSQQLKMLLEANLIRKEKRGKYVYYHINTSSLEDVISWLISINSQGKR